MHNYFYCPLRYFGIISLGLLLLAIADSGCMDRNNIDPAFQNQALSEWVDQLGISKLESNTRQRAVLAVQSIGTNALPFLINQIKLGNAINGQRRIGIVVALEVLGESGRIALPDLADIAARGDDRSADTALWALSRMGSSGVDAITNALTQSIRIRQLKIVRMLHSMGTNAHAAVPALLLCLSIIEEDYDLAFWAGCGAAQLSLQPDKIVPALATNLLVGSSACRYGSASGLCLLGSRAKEAVPALRRLLLYTNESVRYAASNALTILEQ